MANDEKNRLGDKLRDIRAARESEWVLDREQALLKKLHDRTPHIVGCPECKQELLLNTDVIVGGLVCPQRHGAWFDWDTLVKVMDRSRHANKY
jgi:hypothetical protein